MSTAETSGNRWLRLLLALGAFGAACCGQYWLSIEYRPDYSIAAWVVAAGTFILLFWLSPPSRALPTQRELQMPRQLEWGLALAAFAICLFIKLYRLTSFPPGLNHDAAWEGQYAIHILNGAPYTPYISAAWGRETMTFYLQAVTIYFLGRTTVAVQLPSIIGGIVILPFMYWWGRTMFGPRLALVAAWLMGVSGWYLVFSRTGWRSDFQPFFTILSCLFFIRAMRTKSAIDFALAGLFVAATVNTYNAARVFPVVLPLWVALVALQSGGLRGFLHRYGRGLSWYVLSFTVFVAPMVWYAANNWVKFQGRAAYLVGSKPLWGNIRATLLMFHYWANGDDFFVNTPGLEYLTGICFAFGLLWCVLRLRDERSQFLLIGLLVGVVPGIASNPNMNRNIGALPFIFMMAALGAVFFVRELTRVIPRASEALAAIAIVALGAGATYATYQQYLGPNARTVWGYYPETTVLGEYMSTLMKQYRVWVGGANFPRDTLTYFAYNGGDPFTPQYIWLDDVSSLLKSNNLQPTAAKGLAFVLAAEGEGTLVLGELERRYPTHKLVELRYPREGGRVFAKAVLVAPDGGATDTPLPAGAEEAAGGGDMGTAAEVPKVQAGHLREPRGLALTSDGEVVVCDFGHERLQVFDRSLAYVRGWGGPGEDPGSFKQAAGVAVGPNDEIYVADTWNQRIQVFQKDGKYLRQWVSGFFSPRGIAVDAKGTVYVADSGNDRILRFTSTGEKEAEWGKGVGGVEFREPIGIAIDAAGRILVADNGNGKLKIFTRDGKEVQSFSVSGWGSQAYSEPHIAVDPKGRIWVSVPNSKEIRAYDDKGKLLQTIRGGDQAGAPFVTPMGIAYDASGKSLVVADLENRIVRIPTGD